MIMTLTSFAYITLAIRVERVRKSGLFSGVNGQAVVVLDLNPSNGVGTLEGIKRRKPGGRVLVALGLVKVGCDGGQLGLGKVIGEFFAPSGSPIPGPADPGFLQRNDMVLEMYSQQKRHIQYSRDRAGLQCRDRKPK